MLHNHYPQISPSARAEKSTYGAGENVFPRSARPWSLVHVGISIVLVLISARALANDESGANANFGYRTITEALQDLRSQPDWTERHKDGWVIFENKQQRTIWTFTPPSHPAHPAGVKRAVVFQNDELVLLTDLLCGGPKEECDKLAATYATMSQGVVDEFKR